MPDRKARDKKPHALKPQFQPHPPRTGAQRQVDHQAIKERFLIVCEGTKTEPNYFEGFRVPGQVLEVIGTGYNTESLVEEAIRLKQEQSQTFDQCWCVFDRDSFAPDAFNNAIRKAEAANFKVAYTNEAFELWYLLHFDDHQSALSRQQYGPILEQRLEHEYQKNSVTMYRELEERQEQAIRRAERLLAKYGAGHNPQRDNPCTTVHLLVKELSKNARL
jgi:hypothetical protein